MRFEEMKEAVGRIVDPSSAVISLYERSNEHNDVSVDIYTEYAANKRLVFRDYSYGTKTYEQVLKLVLKHIGTGITINLYPGDTVVYYADGRVDLEGLSALRARDQERAMTDQIFETRSKIAKLEEDADELEAALSLIGNAGEYGGALTRVTWDDEDDVVTAVGDEEVRKHLTSDSCLMIDPKRGVTLHVTPPEEDKQKVYGAWGSQIEGFRSYGDAYNRLKAAGVGVSVERHGHLLAFAFCPSPADLTELIRLRVDEIRAHAAGLKTRLESLRAVELASRRFDCSFWMSSDAVARMYKR